MDLRAEDHGFAKQAFKWIARLPTEPAYLIYDGYLVSDKADQQTASEYARTHNLAVLPRGWWEWVEALGPDDKVVKAAKLPRETDHYTPENTDEANAPKREPAMASAFESKIEQALGLVEAQVQPGPNGLEISGSVAEVMSALQGYPAGAQCTAMVMFPRGQTNAINRPPQQGPKMGQQQGMGQGMQRPRQQIRLRLPTPAP